MQNIYARIRDAILRFMHGDLAKALAFFDKATAKLEKYIAIAETDLEKAHAGIESLKSFRDAKNLEVDRAYRTLHNLSQLVK